MRAQVSGVAWFTARSCADVHGRKCYPGSGQFEPCLIISLVFHCKPIIGLWLRPKFLIALQAKVSSSYTMCFWHIWDDALDRFDQEAFTLVLGDAARRAFDL